MRRALLACYEKDEALLRLAALLYNHGWSLMASVGTAKYVSGSGIPCRDISQIIGPMMQHHKIVTLDRKIYAGLLAKTEADITELHTLGILPIDLVYIRLYPTKKKIMEPSATMEEVAEEMDLGGPSILRAAVKGGRLALCQPGQIDDLERWLVHGAPSSEHEDLFVKFAATAVRCVADHVEASARYWEQQAAIHMHNTAKLR